MPRSARTARHLDISSHTVLAVCDMCDWRSIAAIEDEAIVRRDLLLHSREHPEDKRTWAIRDTHRKWLARHNMPVPIGAFA